MQSMLYFFFSKAASSEIKTKSNSLKNIKKYEKKILMNDISGALQLKVQTCKLYNNKYIIASTQITNTEILKITISAGVIISYRVIIGL